MKKQEFTYQVILRNDDDVIISKRMVKVNRVSENSAKDYVTKKFPYPYFVERYS